MDTLNLFKDFDETAYLKHNPDVSAAVDKQAFSSGKEHFIKCGIFENRPGLPKVIQDYIDRLNVEIKHPPEKLRLRVHGDKSLQEFTNAGKFVSYNLYASILPLIEKQTDNRILDFGCGCGRIVSYFSKLFQDNHFYGSDIDPEAIAWCQDNLQHLGEFKTNKELPTLSYADNFFDIVYSISVFTHLPEDMQFQWLEELKRITRKGGHLLLTTHGEHLAPKPIQWELKNSGFHYSVSEGTEGLPDFYQTSFHTNEYIRDQWSRYFEIVKVIKRGIHHHQDLVICRVISD